LKKRWNTIAWSIWAAAGLLLELIALHDKKKGDTLSEHVWSLFRRPFIYAMGAGLLVWMLLHFLSFGKLDKLLGQVAK